MTATTSPAPPALDTDGRDDPTMEDILASIRKIIADDEAKPAIGLGLRPSIEPSTPGREPEAPQVSAGATAMPPARPGSRPGAPMFGLSRPGAVAGLEKTHAPPATGGRSDVSPPPEPSFPRATRPAETPRFDHGVLKPAASLKPTSETSRQFGDGRPAHGGDEPFNQARGEQVHGADDAGALVSGAVSSSVSSAFQALTTSVALTNGEVVDRHVREMLRPMLKRWLDDNLPTIVERLVRAEIERVARGGR